MNSQTNVTLLLFEQMQVEWLGVFHKKQGNVPPVSIVIAEVCDEVHFLRPSANHCVGIG